MEFILIVISLGVLYFLFATTRLSAKQTDNQNSIVRCTAEEILPVVKEKLAAGEGKISVIKYVREQTGLDLATAKQLVDNQSAPVSSLSGYDLFTDIQQKLRSGMGEIEVIKAVRQQYGVSLKDAKNFVDQVKNQL